MKQTAQYPARGQIIMYLFITFVHALRNAVPYTGALG